MRTTSGTLDSYPPGDEAITGVMISPGADSAKNGNSYLIDTTIFPTTTDPRPVRPSRTSDARCRLEKDCRLRVGFHAFFASTPMARSPSSSIPA